MRSNFPTRAFGSDSSSSKTANRRLEEPLLMVRMVCMDLAPFAALGQGLFSKPGVSTRETPGRLTVPRQISHGKDFPHVSRSVEPPAGLFPAQIEAGTPRGGIAATVLRAERVSSLSRYTLQCRNQAMNPENFMPGTAGPAAGNHADRGAAKLHRPQDERSAS